MINDFRSLWYAYSALLAPRLAITLYRLDYQGRQIERLHLEQKIQQVYKDNQFVDVNKMICKTVYSPDKEIFNKYLKKSYQRPSS